VIDLQMETDDAGLKLLEALRQNPETLNLSVIICSANVALLSTMQEQLTQLGAEAIAKPFQIEHFLQTVKQLLVARPS